MGKRLSDFWKWADWNLFGWRCLRKYYGRGGLWLLVIDIGLNPNAVFYPRITWRADRAAGRSFTWKASTSRAQLDQYFAEIEASRPPLE